MFFYTNTLGDQTHADDKIKPLEFLFFLGSILLEGFVSFSDKIPQVLFNQFLYFYIFPIIFVVYIKNI